MPGLQEILHDYVLHWIVQRGKERHLGEKEPPLTEGARTKIGARLQHEMLPYVLTTDAADRLFERSAFGKPCSKIQFEAPGINLFAECSRD